jgi:hypothetical protein
MLNFGPYILVAIVAIVVFVVVWLQARSAGKRLLLFEEQLSSLGQKLSAMEDALRNELRNTGEEKDLKISQLRDELRSTLTSFVESAGKKIAESAAAQNARIDKLAERIAAPVQRQDPPKPQVTKAPEQAPEQAPAAAKESPAHQKARRLARLIVSEIVLYNQAAVDEGVKSNRFAELLAHDIREARTLYAQRVPEEIRKETSYLEEAFAELISRKKREFNMT